ncbi:hypothetical protein CAEBREN_16751 [Caenorhabditis brenneri]|uniref:Uncharacterized protein n=1 Tax=Caenorhabditis brenneri TaxID=135651 RepID=G0N5I0_CAEBE|nr:hypothetical protein CAEBREN_16751 [Caenorhabditis brenneri]
MLRIALTRSSRAMSVASQASASDSETSVRKIGKALETYLKNSQQHVAMMEKHRAEFETGRRHLAKMMSLDIHELDQAAIDRAIQYLFPSGLTDPNARPVMRPPDEILPKFQRFTFDEEGKPEGTRFFTLNPKIYGLLSEIGVKTQSVMKFYDEHVGSRSVNRSDLEPANLSGSQWITADKMKKKLSEKFTNELYGQVIIAFEHLASLPGSAIEQKFLSEFREPMTASTGSKLFGPAIPEVKVCAETNRRYAEVTTHCKDTRATVKVTDAGKGTFNIDGLQLHDFRHLQAREILLAPMIISQTLGRFDVTATTECISNTLPEAPNREPFKRSGGMSALPRAVRHGTALCVAALHPESIEPLRLSGLLTLDPRKNERSKVNQPGARAKWIWKRR